MHGLRLLPSSWSRRLKCEAADTQIPSSISDTVIGRRSQDSLTLVRSHSAASAPAPTGVRVPSHAAVRASSLDVVRPPSSDAALPPPVLPEPETEQEPEPAVRLSPTSTLLERLGSNADAALVNNTALALDWCAAARSKHAVSWVTTFSITHVDKLTLATQARLAARWIQLALHRLAKGVCTILLHHSGHPLHSLKKRIDALTEGGLACFVWSSLAKPWRNALLAHFRRDDMRLQHMQVFSDIDNTWLPSRDPGFPKGCGPYPGGRALYSALVGGGHHLNNGLIFLSARPGNYSNVKKKTYATLRQLGYRSHIIFGNFSHCIPRPWFKPLNPLGTKKAENFREWCEVHQEHVSLFFGDSGEADIDAGLKMIRQEPDHLMAIFIHDLGNLSTTARDRYTREGVLFYRTMVGAAVQAYDKRFISKEQLQEIGEAARADFNAIPFVFTTQKEARWTELAEDLAALDTTLSAAA